MCTCDENAFHEREFEKQQDHGDDGDAVFLQATEQTYTQKRVDTNP